MLFLAALFFFLGGRIIYFDTGPRFYCTQNFVTAGDDLITLLQALGDLDIRRSTNTGIHGHKLSLLMADHEHALHFFLLLRSVHRSACSLHRSLARLLLFEISAVADR